MNLRMRLKSLPSELSLPPPAGLSSSNPGLWNLIYAAVFPVGLLMVVLSGAELYTGALPCIFSHCLGPAYLPQHTGASPSPSRPTYFPQTCSVPAIHVITA